MAPLTTDRQLAAVNEVTCMYVQSEMVSLSVQTNILNSRPPIAQPFCPPLIQHLGQLPRMLHPRNVLSRQIAALLLRR